MKKFSIFFVILLLGLSSVLIKAQQIQWETQTAPGLTVFNDPLLILSTVDQNTCWGIENYEFGQGTTNHQFVLTTDAGTTWSVSQASIPSGSGVEAIYARDAQTAWIAVYDPGNSANSGIYKTTNSGASWQQQANAFIGGGHPAIIYFYNKSDTGICVGTPRNSRFEAYTTNNGGNTWNPVGANMPTVDSGDLFPTGGTGSGNTFLFGTYLRKVYRSVDRGVTWTKINYNAAPSGAGVDIQLKDNLNGLACTYFGDNVNRVAKTTDGGMTWSSQPNPSSQPSCYFLSYVPGTSGWYVVTSHNNNRWDNPTIPGSAYTTDNGDTWHLIDTKPHGPASFADDGYGWSAGIGDTIYRISRDVLPVELTSFTANTNIAGQVVINWQTATEINNRVFEIQRKTANAEYITVGFVNGAGTTTDPHSYSFIDKNVNTGNYTYRLKQIDFDGHFSYSNEVNVSAVGPASFNLAQNYPNPFNPSTNISYNIPETGFVNLKVFNALGQQVATLVKGIEKAGSHTVTFNSANLPSGIYFYKLSAGSLTETKKMILLK